MRRRTATIGLIGLAASTACSSGSSRRHQSTDPNRIAVDGSSTVYPLSEVVADTFRQSSRAPISVNESGTGGGFRAFCQGELTINGASRPISEEEIATCRQNNVEFIELPVAYDGIVVATNADNTWAAWMNLQELRTLFSKASEGRITKWNQVRENWPDREFHIYAPGRDSGTFDTFTERALGSPGEMRSDYDASEDDNYIVRRLRRDIDGIGFFGYGYYATNRGVLNAVGIDDGNEANGGGAVTPSPTTIADGLYQPLSRPLFIYVNKAKLESQEGAADFAKLYLEQAQRLVPSAGMILLRQGAYELALQRLQSRHIGSTFAYTQLGEGLTVEDAMRE